MTARDYVIVTVVWLALCACAWLVGCHEGREAEQGHETVTVRSGACE